MLKKEQLVKACWATPATLFRRRWEGFSLSDYHNIGLIVIPVLYEFADDCLLLSKALGKEQYGSTELWTGLKRAISVN